MSEVSTIFSQIQEQYLTLLVFASIIPTMYAIVFSGREKDERGQKITSTAYQFTYFFCLAGILILFVANRTVDLTFEDFRTGLITILLLANFFLGATIFRLNMKY
ncbi:hypothetical protein [Jeotgalibacillus aurantiacus]|uniref:hypothetical protein n=1 Tax=Jeotgalibacillus aurantiacus TaxID=2763266 RepID=UPI001D0BA9CB|nr:hypothetical protein [Jeotgalibacillus aurantiacus]